MSMCIFQRWRSSFLGYGYWSGFLGNLLRGSGESDGCVGGASIIYVLPLPRVYLKLKFTILGNTCCKFDDDSVLSGLLDRAKVGTRAASTPSLASELRVLLGKRDIDANTQ